jgi:hypothetical protein
MVDGGVGGNEGGDRLRGGEVVDVGVVVHSDGHSHRCRLVIGEEKELDWEHTHCHNPRQLLLVWIQFARTKWD